MRVCVCICITSHFAAYLTLMQHCNLTILRFFKVVKKKKQNYRTHILSEFTKKKKKNHEVAYVTSHIFRTWSHGHTNCLGNMEFSDKIITCPAKLRDYC